ncbi:hypothetical protein AUJ66_00635 [Candidatus Desantisbacteria bacterium CG1_02_38_46]|nr:MAG: hypothetical protein AUJ66_00635 [Candidatus Desantisbacteria bacterium CG1_02_38_46]
MNFNELFDVSPAKVATLRERIERLKIDISDIEEQFIRGGGKGGQKINKTANCVRLSYPPLGIQVRMQKDRKRSINRFLALRELVDKIEMRISPRTSKWLKEIEKARHRKSAHRRRTLLKYGHN